MTLEELRTEIERVDKSIIELIGQRQLLSEEIGRTKRASGFATRSFEREKEVIEKARTCAAAAGVSSDLAESIVTQLIRSSLTVQERDRVSAERTGSGKSVLIIGGAGKMGRWFVRFLSTQGFRVEIADPAGAVEGLPHISDWSASSLHHDIIVVAAPLRASNDILQSLAARRPPGLIFDIGSLKTPLREGLSSLRSAGLRVASVHPMFGPDTELLSGQHVIFVDVGNKEAVRQAEDLFRPTMAIRVPMDLDSHDRLMAFVLGMSHALNIAFFSALAESGEDAPRLSEVSSTTFARQKAIAQSVAAENPRLYFEIQSLNDFGDAALSSLQRSIEHLRSVVRDRDEEAFVRMMMKGLTYLSPRSNV